MIVDLPIKEKLTKLQQTREIKLHQGEKEQNYGNNKI